MSELTKEYFDQTVKSLATKQDLKANTENLKTYVKEHVKTEIESLAVIVNNGFIDIQRRLDVTDRVKNLENDMTRIKGALRLN